MKHPLALIQRARERGWHVLLDAAAFAPTNRLDLRPRIPISSSSRSTRCSAFRPEWVASIARNSTLAALERPWFAGGTVNFASVHGRRRVLAPREAGFEDGTMNYLSIPAVEIGLRRLGAIGMEAIGTRVGCLTEWLIARLLELRHGNGRALVRIYGPASGPMRGGTVTMNFYDPDGHLIDYRRIDELAGLEAISLRTGCFCNPGAGEWAEGLTDDDMLAGGRWRGPDPAALPPDRAAPGKKRRRDPRLARPRQQFRRRRALRRLRCVLPRPDDADHRRGDVRHRIVPGDPRRGVGVAPEIGRPLGLGVGGPEATLSARSCSVRAPKMRQDRTIVVTRQSLEGRFGPRRKARAKQLGGPTGSRNPVRCSLRRTSNPSSSPKTTKKSTGVA